MTVYDWLVNEAHGTDMLKVVMLQARRGENEYIKGDIIHREIITSNNYTRRLEKLRAIARGIEPEDLKARLYVTLNNRSWEKALPAFQSKITGWCIKNKKDKIKNLNRNYISELQKPESRGNRGYYLVDIDIKDKYLKEDIKEKIADETSVFEPAVEKETPNGYHLAYRPFDVRVLEPFAGVEVKKDAMILLETFGFEGD